MKNPKSLVGIMAILKIFAIYEIAQWAKKRRPHNEINDGDGREDKVEHSHKVKKLAVTSF